MKTAAVDEASAKYTAQEDLLYYVENVESYDSIKVTECLEKEGNQHIEDPPLNDKSD